MISHKKSNTLSISPSMLQTRKLTEKSGLKTSRHMYKEKDNKQMFRTKNTRYFEWLSLQAYLLNMKIVTKKEPDLRTLGSTYRSSIKQLRTRCLIHPRYQKIAKSFEHKSRRMHDLGVEKPKLHFLNLSKKVLQNPFRGQSEDSKQYGNQNRRTREILMVYSETKYLRKRRLRTIFRRVVWTIFALKVLMEVLPDHTHKGSMEKKKQSTFIQKPQRVPLIRLKSMAQTKFKMLTRGDDKRFEHRRNNSNNNPLIGTRLSDYIDSKILQQSLTVNHSPQRSFAQFELAKHIKQLQQDTATASNTSANKQFSIMKPPPLKFRDLQIGKRYGMEQTPTSRTNLRNKNLFSSPESLRGSKTYRQLL